MDQSVDDAVCHFTLPGTDVFAEDSAQSDCRSIANCPLPVDRVEAVERIMRKCCL